MKIIHNLSVTVKMVSSKKEDQDPDTTVTNLNRKEMTWKSHETLQDFIDRVGEGITELKNL